MSTFLAMLLLIVSSAQSSAGKDDFAETCPLRFSSSAGDRWDPRAPSAIRAPPGLSRVNVPLQRAYHLVRASGGKDSNPVYWYHSESSGYEPARNEDLARLPGSLQPLTAAEDPDVGTSVMKEGWFRVVLRYFSPGLTRAGSVRVCTAISHAFWQDERLVSTVD